MGGQLLAMWQFSLNPFIYFVTIKEGSFESFNNALITGSHDWGYLRKRF